MEWEEGLEVEKLFYIYTTTESSNGGTDLLAASLEAVVGSRY